MTPSMHLSAIKASYVGHASYVEMIHRDLERAFALGNKRSPEAQNTISLGLMLIFYGCALLVGYPLIGAGIGFGYALAILTRARRDNAP